jgi:Ca2+-binding RTX toxin-like protein
VTQTNNFIAALTAWDQLIAPNFTQVLDNGSGHGEVRVAFTSEQMSPGTAGYAFQGSNQVPTSIVGDVWLNSNDTASNYDSGTDDYVTLLHELGHVLGLKHSFEGTPIPAPYDDSRYTVMSYTTPTALIITPTGGGGYSIVPTSVNALTPSVLDIAAVQDLYGADTSTNSGNTTYIFNQSSLTFYSIWDTGGTDTIDLSSITRGSEIDLNAGAYSSVGHWTEAQQITFYANLTGDSEANIGSFFANDTYYEWVDNLGIAFGVTIENLVAGSGNDTIIGNGAGNLINLRMGGNDTADGGAGDDGFYFGATLTAGDSVDGGAGTNDQLALQGNYVALTLAAGHLVNTEALVLLPGNDTRFGDLAGNSYSYNITTVDANVAAGQVLTVNWNTLRSGENVTFNGSAEVNGSFLTYGGQGTDQLTGGQQSDGFLFRCCPVEPIGFSSRWCRQRRPARPAGQLHRRRCHSVRRLPAFRHRDARAADRWRCSVSAPRLVKDTAIT